MSAICAHWQRQGAPVTRRAIDAMVASMAHRGPDGSQAWSSGSLAMGYQHLAVTPESLHEQLPLYDAQSQIALTASTRLDNRTALCDLLRIPVAERQTTPDSRLILGAYLRWGERCVQQLLGAFAFVLWDGCKRQLLCAVDPMGERALYCALTPTRCLVATEIGAILTVTDVAAELNPAHLARIAAPGISLLLPAEQNRETLFDGVERVLPATILVVSETGSRSSEFWTANPDARLNYRRDDEFYDALQDLLFTAVRDRIRSVHPVGVLLSGGLDSSAVASVAATLLARQGSTLTTLTAVAEADSAVRFPDERDYLNAFQRWENLDSLLIAAPGRGPFSDPMAAIVAAESPRITPFHYLYTAFGEAAHARAVRVLLDGVGGELGVSMRGRSGLARHLRLGRWRTVRRQVRQASATTGRPPWRLLARDGLAPLLPEVVQGWLRAAPPPSLLTMNHDAILQPDFVERHLGEFENAWRQRMAQLHAIDSADRKVLALRLAVARRGLTPDRPVGGSGWGRTASPLFDQRVIEFCLAAPARLRYGEGLHRYLIRRSLKGLLPEEIYRRRTKAPFAADFPLRYNRQRRQVVDWLASISPQDPVRAIVNVARVQQLADHAFEDSDPGGRAPANHAAMHVVPQGLFLILFLRQFSPYTLR